MEPAENIALLETTLRGLVAMVMRTAHGDDWIMHLPEQTRARLRERHGDEQRRRAPASVSSALLDYTHLYELLEIVRKDWERFSPALGKKRDFEVLMSFAEDYRNAPAHSRTLLPWERDLLSGIAGVVRTAVTTYRSNKGPDMEFYPIIERVRDVFGNEVAEHDQWTNTARPRLELHVGDVVRFECSGWDPHGRELIWWGSVYGGHSTLAEARGTSAALDWTVSEGDVGDSMTVFLYMRSVSKFHRQNGWDDVVGFEYRVIPPSL